MATLPSNSNFNVSPENSGAPYADFNTGSGTSAAAVAGSEVAAAAVAGAEAAAVAAAEAAVEVFTNVAPEDISEAASNPADVAGTDSFLAANSVVVETLTTLLKKSGTSRTSRASTRRSDRGSTGARETLTNTSDGTSGTGSNENDSSGGTEYQGTGSVIKKGSKGSGGTSTETAEITYTMRQKLKSDGFIGIDLVGPGSGGGTGSGDSSPAGEEGDVPSDTLDEETTGTSTIETYESTIYDTQITGSGFTSAYLSTLAIAPMKNFFEYNSENFSNIGSIFSLQNQIKDSAVKSADQIISNYYASFPSVASALQQTRDENLSKYNFLLSSLSTILAARQSFLEKTEATAPSDDAISAVESAISNGAKNNAPFYEVSFVDDDVTKYDNGKKVELSLSERLLGDYSDNPLNEQARTTRQYQILKAAIAQSQEGIRFDLDSLESSAPGTSPYQNLEYEKVASIRNYLSDNIEPTYDYQIAKRTLRVAASVITNDFLPTIALNVPATPDPVSTAVLNFFKNYHLSMNGNMSYTQTEIAPGVPGQTVWSQDEKYETGSDFDRTSYVYPAEFDVTNPVSLTSVGLYCDDLSQSFINQIPIVLAQEIMEETYEIPSFYALPDSINPEISSNVSTAETATLDALKYALAISLGDKNVFLFDESLKNKDEYSGEDVGEIVRFNYNDLSNAGYKLLYRVTGLKNLLAYHGNRFSPNCALKIIEVFYRYIKGFFSGSVLSGNRDDQYNALRVVTMLQAAQDNDKFGSFFRVFVDREKTMAGKALSGGTIDADQVRFLYSFFVNISSWFGRTFEYGEDSSDPIVLGNLSVAAGGTDNLSTKTYSWNLQSTETNFWENLGNFGTGYFDYPNLVSAEIAELYPAIAGNTTLLNKIKFAFMTMFVYYIRKMRITLASNVTQEASNRIDFSGNFTWYPADAAFISDCFEEAFTVTDVESLAFANFISTAGAPPTSGQYSSMSSFFAQIRSPIKHALQINRDLVTSLAYQKYVLDLQYLAIYNISLTIGQISTNVYAGDSDKAVQVTSRYQSFESISEALYRSKRYLTLIPGTSISSIATRSSNYRSIIEATYNDLIPAASSDAFENYKICAIGIPYGHLEQIRLDQGTRTYYFSLKAITDNISLETDEPSQIDYQFPFILNLESVKPGVPGPYSSRILGIYDDFNEDSSVQSVENEGIRYYVASVDGSSFKISSQSDASEDEKQIDFKAALVQAALESYFEDVYGLYPRYASTKSPMRSDPYPEEEIVDDILAFSNISAETTEQSLIFSRLKSIIMMHQDFMTTRMLEELESSPLFDRIFYILIDGNKFPEIVSQFYVKLEA